MSYDGVRTTLNKDISHPLRFSHFCRLPVGRYEIQQDSKDAPVVLIGCPFSKNLYCGMHKQKESKKASSRL